MSRRVTAADFEDLYVRSADPWGFETSRDERAKHAATIRALDWRRYAGPSAQTSSLRPV